MQNPGGGKTPSSAAVMAVPKIKQINQYDVQNNNLIESKRLSQPTAYKIDTLRSSHNAYKEAKN